MEEKNVFIIEVVRPLPNLTNPLLQCFLTCEGRTRVGSDVLPDSTRRSVCKCADPCPDVFSDGTMVVSDLPGLVKSLTDPKSKTVFSMQVTNRGLTFMHFSDGNSAPVE